MPLSQRMCVCPSSSFMFPSSGVQEQFLPKSLFSPHQAPVFCCDITNDRAAELLFLKSSLFSWALYSALTSTQTEFLVLRSTDRGPNCPVHYQLGSQTRLFSTKYLHPFLPLLTSTRPPKLNILLILLGLATAAVSGGVVREFWFFSVKIFQQKACLKKERR